MPLEYKIKQGKGSQSIAKRTHCSSASHGHLKKKEGCDLACLAQNFKHKCLEGKLVKSAKQFASWLNVLFTLLDLMLDA